MLPLGSNLGPILFKLHFIKMTFILLSDLVRVNIQHYIE